ncbi:hypothetical protein L1049_021175 [Liquidambar formosana]|uniref:PGG domain-containing protein n=1 Tax=Liquidambar formosana TaxID=63359 RepID=A0AAP0X6Q7_LIQFO
MTAMNPKLYKAATSGDISYLSSIENDSSNSLLQETREKNSALHLAVKCNQKQFAEKIIDLHPQLLNHANSEGETPLHIVARVGNLDMVKFFLSCSDTKSQEVEAQNGLLSKVNLEGDTVLHHAVRYGHFEIVKLLIKKDPELTNLVNDNGESPLFLAVDRKHFKIASHILEAVPACSYQGRNNMNVLHAAVIRTQTGHQIKIFMDIWARYVDNPLYNLLYEFLHPMKLVGTRLKDRLETLDHGSEAEVFMRSIIKKCSTEITKADDFGWTPLHYAANLRYTKAAKLLMESNTDVAYMKDKEGMSAFHLAAKEGHEIVMKEIVKLCPEAYELRDNSGRTALHVAAESGKASAVEYLVNTPDLVDLTNQKDKEGNTPLHLAAIHGHLVIMSKLASRDNRVDKEAKNKDGFTTIELISKIELRRFQRAWMTMKLVLAGAQPSLEGVLVRENPKTKNVEMKEQAPQTERERDPAENKDSKYERLQNAANSHSLVATIIATVSFAAAFTMPGGYDSNEPHRGMAVLCRKSAFKTFLIANTVAFCCSAASMLMHFWAALHGDYNVFLYFIRFAASLTYYSIFGMLTAFISGANVVLAESPGLATANLGTRRWRVLNVLPLNWALTSPQIWILCHGVAEEILPCFESWLDPCGHGFGSPLSSQAVKTEKRNMMAEKRTTADLVGESDDGGREECRGDEEPRDTVEFQQNIVN